MVRVLWAGTEVNTEFPPSLPSRSQLPYIQREVSGINPSGDEVVATVLGTASVTVSHNRGPNRKLKWSK